MQKSTSIYVWKCSKYTSEAVSISCIAIKKNMKISYTNTYLFKDFSANIATLKWSITLIPYSLQPSQKRTNLNKTLTSRNLFRLNIYSIYFPLKRIFFTVHVSFLIRTFSLYQKKTIPAFIKRIADHFYHKCGIEYWLTG